MSRCLGQRLLNRVFDFSILTMFRTSEVCYSFRSYDNYKQLLPVIYMLFSQTPSKAVQGSTGCSLDIFPELGWLAILSELRRQEESMRGNSVTFARKVKAPVTPPPTPVEIVVEAPPVRVSIF